MPRAASLHHASVTSHIAHLTVGLCYMHCKLPGVSQEPQRSMGFAVATAQSCTSGEELGQAER
jgi:hypothetical protein